MARPGKYAASINRFLESTGALSERATGAPTAAAAPDFLVTIEKEAAKNTIRGTNPSATKKGKQMNSGCKTEL